MGNLDEILQVRPLAHNADQVSPENMLQQAYTDSITNQFILTGNVGSDQKKYLPPLVVEDAAQDINPWHKQAEAHSTWENVISFFHEGDTVGQRVRDSVIQSLSPAEAEKFSDEEKAQVKFESGDLPFKLPPPVQMHDEVNLRTNNIESNITAKVNATLTPEQLQAISRDQGFMGPVDYSPHLYLGPAIKEYYHQLSLEEDKEFPPK